MLEDDLKPGMNAQAEILVADLPDVLARPDAGRSTRAAGRPTPTSTAAGRPKSSRSSSA